MSDILKILLQAELDVNNTANKINKDLEQIQRKIKNIDINVKNDLKNGIQIDQFKELNAEISKIGRFDLSNTPLVKGMEIVGYSVKEAKDGTVKFTQSLNDGKNKIITYSGEVNKTANNYEILGKSTRQATRENQTFIKELGIAIKRTVEWSVAVGGYYKVIREIKEGVQFINETDKSLNQIQMITGLTAKEVNNLAVEYSELGKQMGITTNEILKGSVEWFRQGKSMTETTQLMKASIMEAKLAGIDTASATEYLTSTLNGFKLEASEATDVVSKMVAIDNIAATSVEELSVALQRSATSAQQAGVEIDTLLAYVGTVSSVSRRSASSIGESFKTIFARMQDIKQGKLDEEGMGLSDVESALNRVGIAVRSSETDFRDLDDVISDVAQRWSTLDKVTQSSLGKAIAGTRQRENFLVLMNNYNKSLQLEEESINSAGLAQERYAIYLESTEAKLAQLQATTDKMWLNFLDSNAIKTGIDLLSSLVGGIDQLVNHTEILGGSLIGLAGAFLMAYKAMGKLTLTEYIAKYATMATTTNLLTIAQTGLAGVTALVGKSFMFLFTTPLGWITLAIGGVLALSNHLRKQREEVEKLTTTYNNYKASLETMDIESQKQSINEITEYQKKLEELIVERDKLKKASNNDRWSLLRIQGKEDDIDKLIEQIKSLGFEIDETTGKIKDLDTLSNNVKIDEKVNSLTKLLDRQVRENENLTALIDNYNTLSQVENKNAQQKESLNGIIRELKNQYDDLIIATDEEGNMQIKNINILNDKKTALLQEKDILISSTKSKITALMDETTVVFNNTKTTIGAIRDRIDGYNEEIKVINQRNKAAAGTVSDSKTLELEDSALKKYRRQNLSGAFDYINTVDNKIDDIFSKYSSGTGMYIPSGANSKTSSSSKETLAIADQYERINQLLADNNNQLELTKRYITDAKEGSAEQLTLIEKENALYKERQNLLNQLNEQRRAEAIKLENDLSKQGFNFVGSGDARRISNLGNIQGKSKEVEEMFNRYNELQTNLIPQTSQQWFDYQQSIVSNIEKIESTIQSHIDQLNALKDELADFDLSGKIEDLDKQLNTAKFNHWIESLILGLERYNDKTELLSFKLSLFDEEDYENRSDVIGDLFNASKDKLKAYREEWDKLSAQTPKNANEASQIANAMKQVQQGMREAFVATREYQRELEQLQFDSISSEFEKANKQLELQLSIIDHNLQSLQDGILPDFSLDMVMPIPDFSDIFDETASENEKIYNEQARYEREIQSLKKQSLEMQLDEAEKFYEEEKAKLIKHYKELVKQIADKEAEILELQQFADEQQKSQLQNTAAEIQSIVNADLTTLEGSYATSWGNIVNTVSNSVAEIKRLVSQANSAIASMGSVSAPSGGGSAGSHSGTTGYTNLNPVVNVNSDGKAPSGLPVGTTVKTNGGDYLITKVKPDGSYESKKVPKYAKGTDGHQGGLALLGDERKGAYEMAILPSGKAVIIGETQSQLVDLPKGTQVIPHNETKDILKHTGNIDGKQIPKYKDGVGSVPKYAVGTGLMAGVVSAVASTLASTISKVSGTSAKLKDTTDKLNKANNQIDRLNNKIDDLSNVSYASSTPTASETSEFDKIIESIKPDFAVEMSSTFKEGYDKYIEDRKINLAEIADLQKKYLEGTDEQISKEEILSKIDAQMLEDTRTQSWLKVDLLEQMKASVDAYTIALKEQYDASLKSGNTELAGEIFEEYNSMLTKQMQIEKQIQSAIKERYTMEFALIDKKLDKEKQIQDDLDKDLKLLTIQNPDDTDEILRLNEEILQSQINQGNQIASSITGLIAQRDILEVGSNEWNIINDKIEEYEDSLKDSNISVAEMNKQLAEIKRNDLFKQFENRLRESARLLKVLNYELGLLYEEQRPASLNLMEEKLIAIQNETNIAKENLKEFLTKIGLGYDVVMLSTDYDTTGLTEQQTTDLDSLIDKVRESETSIVDLQKSIEQFRVDKVFADLNNSLRDTVHSFELLDLQMQLISESDFDSRIEILNQQMELTNIQIIAQTTALEELKKVIQQNASERGFVTEEELDNLNQAELAIKQTELQLHNLIKTVEQLEIDKIFYGFEQQSRKTTLALRELNNEMQKLHEDSRSNMLSLMIKQLKETSEQTALFKNQYKELRNKLNEGGLTNEEQQQLDDFKQKLEESEISVVELEKTIREFKVNKVFADLNNTLRETEHILSMLDLQMQLISESDFVGKSSIISKQIDLTNFKLIEQKKAYEELKKVIQRNASERGFITEEELDNLNQAELGIKQIQVELANLEKSKLSNNFNSQLLDIEKELFDGKTYDEANEALNKKIEIENAFIDGLEKELEVQKLKDYARQNEVELSREQLKLLNAQGKIEKESLERIQKQLEIKQLEQKLENLKSQKTIQQLTKKSDGTWDFIYVADQDEIDNTTRELQEKRVELIQWERNITQESERKQLQDKADYLEKLRLITEKALNGEYETYNEFNNSILLLNKTFLTDLTLDSEIKWGELLSAFNGKLSGMKTSYLNYVSEMERLTDRLNKSLTPSVDTKNTTSTELAMAVSTTQQSKGLDELLSNTPDILKFLDTDKLSNMLKSAVLSTMNVVMPKMPNLQLSSNNNGVNQIFNIDKVEFPNITTADEATKAILNLPNKVKQRTRIIGVD